MVQPGVSHSHEEPVHGPAILDRQEHGVVFATGAREARGLEVGGAGFLELLERFVVAPGAVEGGTEGIDGVIAAGLVGQRAPGEIHRHSGIGRALLAQGTGPRGDATEAVVLAEPFENLRAEFAVFPGLALLEAHGGEALIAGGKIRTEFDGLQKFGGGFFPERLSGVGFRAEHAEVAFLFPVFARRFGGLQAGDAFRRVRDGWLELAELDVGAREAEQDGPAGAERGGARVVGDGVLPAKEIGGGEAAALEEVRVVGICFDEEIEMPFCGEPLTGGFAFLDGGKWRHFGQVGVELADHFGAWRLIPEFGKSQAPDAGQFAQIRDLPRPHDLRESGKGFDLRGGFREAPRLRF